MSKSGARRLPVREPPPIQEYHGGGAWGTLRSFRLLTAMGLCERGPVTELVSVTDGTTGRRVALLSYWQAYLRQ